VHDRVTSESGGNVSARIHAGGRRLPKYNEGLRLRILATTTYAIVAGLVNAAQGRHRTVSRVECGEAAPDFCLPASDGATYRLSDFRGKQAVIVAWFPKAFTGGCTAECRSLGEQASAIRSTGVAYFGASIDSVASNASFARTLGVDYPILSDASREAARAFGVLAPSGYASRWTFYIDRAGTIVYIDRDVRPSSHGVDVASKVRELGLS